jgi:hypothetical protein
MSIRSGVFVTMSTDDTHRINVTRTNRGFMVDVEDESHWAALTLDDSQAGILAAWMQERLKEGRG